MLAFLSFGFGGLLFSLDLEEVEVIESATAGAASLLDLFCFEGGTAPTYHRRSFVRVKILASPCDDVSSAVALQSCRLVFYLTSGHQHRFHYFHLPSQV